MGGVAAGKQGFLGRDKRKNIDHLMHRKTIYRYGPFDVRDMISRYPLLWEALCKHTQDKVKEQPQEKEKGLNGNSENSGKEESSIVGVALCEMEKRIECIDWNDPFWQLAFTQASLSVHYGIKLELPVDRLVPMIACRVNYLHWICDLLEEETSKLGLTESIRGLDIGTGASCIYPLLGRAIYGWKFDATDIDPVSVNLARKNVELNGWSDDIIIQRIHNKDSVLLEFFNSVSVESPLKGRPASGNGRCDGKTEPGNGKSSKEKVPIAFTVCNPPFFKDEQEAGDCFQRNRAAPHEAFCKGGEFGFVTRMIRESYGCRNKVLWFTTMVGLGTHAKEIRKVLMRLGLGLGWSTERHAKATDDPVRGVRLCWRESKLCQGKVYRFVFAWTWFETLPPLTKQFNLQKFEKGKRKTQAEPGLENPREYRIFSRASDSLLMERLEDVLTDECQPHSCVVRVYNANTCVLRGRGNVTCRIRFLHMDSMGYKRCISCKGDAMLLEIVDRAMQRM